MGGLGEGELSRDASSWLGHRDIRARLRVAPARTPSIAKALIVKSGDIFCVCQANGDIPLTRIHGMGLYYHDCRFLDGYELRVAGHRLETLVASAARGYQALLELTNPELITPEGTVVAPVETIGVKWIRTLDPETLALHDQLVFRNFARKEIVLPVSLSFRAGFHDIFSVRSLDFTLPGLVLPPTVEGRLLRFVYHGADGLIREVAVCFRDIPDSWEETAAFFLVDLPPHGERAVQLAISVAEHEGPSRQNGAVEPLVEFETVAHRHAQAEKEWRAKQTKVASSSLLLDSIIERSFRDLYLLRSYAKGQEYYAAGVPWFVTLFGRDAILSALQTLAYDPEIARQTLTVLAEYQGTVNDPWRQEQPGKILHELRVGELARTRAVPHSPYYGTVDATPLFLILAAEYYAWTADVETIKRLRPHLEAALRWLNENQDETGYLTYGTVASEAGANGLVNQGWKDSDDGVPNPDGSHAEPPIALVEVQAYAFMARSLMADMYRRLGDKEKAALLEEEAAALRQRFNRDFWMEARGCYALALQRGGRQVRVCSSNAGHVLWSGIADVDQARRTRKRLMRPDMFSGWGIRTLSQEERAYSPVGYHVGTVWPHDNSLILAGFRRYGFDNAAVRLFAGMTRAAMHFELYRLPELFAGFSRQDYEVPVHYPLACRPQSWAAGTVPYMLANLLGLRPEADVRRLNVVSPVLPDYTDWVELRNLRVASDTVDLRFERTPKGVAVQVRRKDPGLEVVVKL